MGGERVRDGGGGVIHHTEEKYLCTINFYVANYVPIWGGGEAAGNTVLKAVVGARGPKLDRSKGRGGDVMINREGGGGGGGVLDTWGERMQ